MTRSAQRGGTSKRASPLTPTSATFSPPTEMPPPVAPNARAPSPAPPSPTVPKSLPLYLCRPFVEATLVKGNFKTIVMLPKYVDIMEWVAVNSAIISLLSVGLPDIITSF
jgi:MOB kinase activator 1